jgi:Transposase protein
VARRHLAMPASTDYWINDRSGDPLLVITGEVDAALTKALPRLLREVRDLVGQRRVTIVFDRGGWSPKLFDAMIKDGFDLLTYRKGRCHRINERRFIRRHAELDAGELKQHQFWIWLSDQKRSHHFVILMREDMAVPDVLTRQVKLGDNTHHRAGSNEDGVLPPSLLWR